jgi:type II restriction enzyme
MIYKFNKGEWSELYTLLKLLIEGKIYIFNELLNYTNDYYLIAAINSTYKIDEDFIYFEKEKINKNNLKNILPILLNEIKFNKGASFNLRNLENLENIINFYKFKKGISFNKNDIYLDILTENTLQKNVGFNIKSYIGGAPTLLNSSKATNFVYKINNIKVNDVLLINNIKTNMKIKDRLKLLKKNNYELEFDSIDNEIFKNNLMKVDTFLPNIISEILKNFYQSDFNKISDLEKSINFTNLDTKLKIKQFLLNSALGFVPTKEWDGFLQSKGYIIVKKNGEVGTFDIFNLKNLANYLFNNTKLDTPSTTRHDFGYIFKKDESFYIKLNLQIRFLFF